MTVPANYPAAIRYDAGSAGPPAVAATVPAAAPAARATSTQINGLGGKHLTIEAFCSAAANVEVETLGPDGVWRVLVSEALAAGAAATFDYPIALGAFRMAMEAAASGWTGYVSARVLP